LPHPVFASLDTLLHCGGEGNANSPLHYNGEGQGVRQILLCHISKRNFNMTGSYTYQANH